MTHAPLIAYIHKFKLVDKPRCPACGDANETVQHFLLSCPGYAHERWALIQTAKKRKKDLSLETLFGDRELTLALANFIKATHRFSQQKQEQLPNDQDSAS